MALVGGRRPACYRQVPVRVTVAVGVWVRFAPASQVTVPSGSFLMSLYSIGCPVGSYTVPFHTG